MSLGAEWRKEMLEAYARGMADVEVCRELGVTRKEFDKLYRNDIEFETLVDHGRGLSMAWWYTVGRENLTNRSFQHPLWYAHMKNRMGWSDKTENIMKDGKSVEDMSEDELRDNLVTLMPSMVKMLQSQMPDLDPKDFLNDKPSRSA
jgi:hypothetical protein